MRVNVSATAHPLEAAVHTPDTAIRDHDGASLSHALNRVALMGRPILLNLFLFPLPGSLENAGENYGHSRDGNKDIAKTEP